MLSWLQFCYFFGVENISHIKRTLTKGMKLFKSLHWWLNAKDTKLEWTPLSHVLVQHLYFPIKDIRKILMHSLVPWQLYSAKGFLPFATLDLTIKTYMHYVSTFMSLLESHSDSHYIWKAPSHIKKKVIALLFLFIHPYTYKIIYKSNTYQTYKFKHNSCLRNHILIVRLIQ